MTITDVIIVAIISAIISVFTSSLSAILQGYKWKSGELPKAKADTDKLKADKDNVITDTSLDLVNGIRAELKIMQEKLFKLEAENNDLRLKLAELEDVREWAERLTHQVISLGGTPVKMHTRVK